MAIIPRRGQVGQDVRRGRGPRLPGGQDVPTVNPAVARDPGLQADPSAFGANIGQASEQLGQGLIQAGARMKQRENVIRTMRAERDLRERLMEQARDFQKEADLTDTEAPLKFAKQAEALQMEILENSGVDGDAKALLTQRLANERSHIVDQIAAAAHKEQVEFADAQIGEQINTLALGVANDPSTLPDAIDAAIDIYEQNSAAFSEGATEAGKRSAVSLLAEVVIDQQFARGDVEGARETLEDPRTQRLLTRDALQTNLRRLAQAEFASGTPVKGIPRDEWNALTPEQRLRILGAASPVEEGRAEGQAAVAKATAILGRPPTEDERAELIGRSPIVSITQEGEKAIAKKLGALDAERVIELETRGQKARRDLSEIERMRAAIDSGGFKTGVFSDTRLFLARLADFVGADEQIISIIGDATKAETLDAAASRLAVQAAENLERATNMQVGLIRDSLPNLTRTPDGNRILLDVMERTSEREIEIAQMANRYIQEFGTLRPQGERSFAQAVSDLEENDPIITDELRQRIAETSQSAPTSFENILGEAEKPPEGYEPPKGYKFIQMKDGRPLLELEKEGRLPDGRTVPAGSRFLFPPVEGLQQDGGDLGPQGSLQPDESGKVPQAKLLASLTDSGLDPVVAAGFVGNLMQESSLNPKIVGDNGQSFGLFQHNRSRAKELFDFARERGEDVPELTLTRGGRIREDLEQFAEEGRVPSAEAQIAFAMQELESEYADAAQAVEGVSDPGEAAKILSEMFFKPSDPKIEKRVAAAKAAARQAG